MLKLTQELFGSADPDTRRSFEPESLMDVVVDFEAYFRALTEDRRAKPTDDVASLIANARIDGEPVPELETTATTSSSPPPATTPRVPPRPVDCWRSSTIPPSWRSCVRILIATWGLPSMRFSVG